jgi:hypothetical protein
MYLYHVLFTFINIYGVDCQKKTILVKGTCFACSDKCMTFSGTC